MTQTTPPKHLVVYADDDIDDLKFVEQAFMERMTNIELVTVRDGAKAIDYLSKLSVLDPDPCLIILDVNMPKLNGKETLLKIRKMDRFENIPVVLFTTSSLEQDRNFAMQYNAGFVTKPLDARQMQRITDQFIEHCSDEIKKSLRRGSN
jgi:CheY-like chemotaxis protein